MASFLLLLFKQYSQKCQGEPCLKMHVLLLHFLKKVPCLYWKSLNSILRKGQLKQTLSLVASIQQYKWDNPVSLRFTHRSMFTSKIFSIIPLFPASPWELTSGDVFCVDLAVHQGYGIDFPGDRAVIKLRKRSVEQACQGLKFTTWQICLSRSHVSQAG